MKIVQYKAMIDKTNRLSYLVTQNTFEYNTEFNNITNPGMIYAIMENIFSLSAQAEEMVYAVMLNTKSVIIGVFEVAHGTVNSAQLQPREIYLRALLSGASYIILVHNHPSQDVVPSESDRVSTERVRTSGEILGLPLSDHIIIGSGYYSFKEQGLL